MPSISQQKEKLKEKISSPLYATIISEKNILIPINVITDE